MKFRRIDSKTVSCIITPEDMKAHGIKLDDIFEKKEEAMEFLHMVVGEAERRVNFRPQGAVTSMQMSVLPDHSISLTISEQSGAMFEEFLNKLQEKLGLNVPDEVRKELGALPEDERVARLREYAAKMLPGASGDAAKSAGMAKADTESGESGTNADAGSASAAVLRSLSAQKQQSDGKTQAAGGQTAQPDAAYMYRFASFRAVCDCCRHLASDDIVAKTGLDAELYNEDGSFYLVIHNPGQQELEFSKLALVLNEFGALVTSREEIIAHFREQVSCILDHSTIKTLAAL